MNIGSILAKVGTSVLKSVVPGAGVIIDLVNEFLPKDKKLPTDSTGAQVIEAANSLPPDKQAEIFSKELDVEIAEIQGWSNVMASLADADKSGNSTRPKIALMMAWVVSFTVIVFVSILAISIFRDMKEMVANLSNSWELVLVMLGTPTALLRAYFAMRTKEKKSRYNIAANQEIKSPLADIIAAFKG